MTTPAEAAVQPPRRRNGWLWLAKLVGILLVVALITVVVWYQSDGDLRAIRAEMTAAGFPTTSQDLGWKQSSAERRALRERLEKLVELPALSGHAQLPGNIPVPGVPLLNDLHTLVAGYPPTLLREMDDLLDQLGTEPVMVEPELGFLTKHEPYWTVRILQYRALVAPSPDFEAHAQRLYNYAIRNRPLCWNDFWMRRHALEALLQVLAYRRTELSDSERELWAQRLRSLTDDLVDQWYTAMRGDLVKLLDCVASPIDRLRRTGNAPAIFYYPLIGQLMLRAGRGPLLRREVEWTVFLRDHRHDLPAIRMEAMRRYDYLTNRRWNKLMSPSAWVAVFSTEWHRVYEADHLCSKHLYALVVAAALTNGPMPVDLFDASGHVVRPLLEGGQVRGVYSVGIDGKDGGGDPKHDLCWPLFDIAKPITPPIKP